MRVAIVFILGLILCARVSGQTNLPPDPPREFRGLWVATVNNIDWPSRPGLSTAQQQAELLAILDRAAALRFNAIIFQVRPDSDAFYASKLEPWSEYLTGVMGQAPSPYYDPLDFAVREAHLRGLELHAWFNPFRVRSLDMKTPVSANFISRQQPDLVRRYGKTYLWLDPGEAAARARALAVVMDVVHRYDIDGVHFDDYFYPYPEKVNNKEVDFPDDASWKRYRADGGKLARNDWRRDNINRFIQSVHSAIKKEKSWVKFGVSPFGIWRPSNPPQVAAGLDAFDSLYADSRRWLASGWVDYLAPQLYWPLSQNFASLLKWWTDENVLGRNLWPGMKVGDWKGAGNPDARETVLEIAAVRHQAGATGEILYRARPIMENHGGVATALQSQAYGAATLVPASPWLSDSNPPAPILTVSNAPGRVRFQWTSGGGPDPWQWVFAWQTGGRWMSEIYPSYVHEIFIPAPNDVTRPTAECLRAVDRTGRLSDWAAPAEQADPPKTAR